LKVEKNHPKTWWFRRNSPPKPSVFFLRRPLLSQISNIRRALAKENRDQGATLVVLLHPVLSPRRLVLHMCFRKVSFLRKLSRNLRFWYQKDSNTKKESYYWTEPEKIVPSLPTQNKTTSLTPVPSHPLSCNLVSCEKEVVRTLCSRVSEPSSGSSGHLVRRERNQRT
jgi:hypothetical protein